MAYDEAMADRVRDQLVEEPDLTERQMFGGLAFLVGGKMAVAVGGDGGIMGRVERAKTDHLIATTKAEPMIMRNQQMQGWVTVDPPHLDTARQLAPWVRRGVAAANAAR